VLLAALAVVVAPLAAGPAAAAETRLCEKYAYAFVSDDRFVVSNQVWGADTPQCVTARDGGFTIASEAHANLPTGSPAAYPGIFAGCHWARCTRGSGLPMAMTDPRFGTITTGLDVTVPDAVELAGTYNVAYDAWFDPTPRTDGQQTGAELMIWLERRGPVQPVGAPVGTVELAGATWEVWFGVSGWNVVSYVRTSPTRSVDLVVADFTSDAIARGYMEQEWYLTNVQAGFEVWSGVAGLSVDDFRYGVDLTEPTPEPVPGCAVDVSVVSSWGDGFQGSITLRNTGATAWEDWELTVPERPGQRVTHAWNASLATASGVLTFRDAGWNSRVAPGRTVSVGVLGRLGPDGSFDVADATVNGGRCSGASP
jgi:hypothetical protein